MPVRYKLKSVKLSGGQEIQFPESGIVVIVGPNNSGKSTLLREIHQVAKNGFDQQTSNLTVAVSINFELEGTSQEIEQFLRENGKIYFNETGQSLFRTLNVNTVLSNVFSWWNHATAQKVGGMHDVTELFCSFVGTETRLSAANSAASINLTSDPPTHPFHVLALRDSLETELSGHVKKAFGHDLILNRGGGSVIPLHIGDRPTLGAGEDRVSESYLNRLTQLPHVMKQGDGIRSYIGSLLSTLVVKRFVTLLDEPEAFLHPPQAKLLGEVLAKENTHKQLLVATHSTDFIKGILSTNSPAPTVMRITRQGLANKIEKLDSGQIEKLWSDPILRFSNILDGLFHEGVIVCEADTDCRFYSAILDALREDEPNHKWPDWHFVSAGGKDRMPVLIAALANLGVKTRVVADFDLLRDERKVAEIVKAIGGAWESTAQGQFKEFVNAVTQKAAPLSPNQVAEAIQSILLRAKEAGKISEDDSDEIKKALKATSYWSQLKSQGLSAVPAGGPRVAIDAVLQRMRALGVFIVPLGELECFDKTSSKHGPPWLYDALTKDIKKSADFADARSFVASFAKTM